MHNPKDGAVPFTQAVEFFTALRRLQKPVWLLQYDEEGHIIGDPDCSKDFTIRQQQFFNHYLKGMPAPSWMKQGIPAALKGIQARLSF
jgi:dipeptidyl aminopeptidase/acylaminoacyl peptidase